MPKLDMDENTSTEFVFTDEDFSEPNSPKWAEGLTQAHIQTELEYIDIAHEIVAISRVQLNRQTESKQSLRKGFTPYFKWLIAAQLVFLAILLLLKGLCPSFRLSDTVIISYITSVFVETLGGVIVMVTYAFNSKEEVEATKILSGVIEHFQK